MLTPTEQDVMKACGESGIRAMVAAFYQRVRTDDLIGPMYPDDDWEGSEERLADFMLFRLGHSNTYMEKRGHPRLRMRHMPFSIGIAERDQWVACMDQAMQETAIDDALRTRLKESFMQTADWMRNRGV